ncbi:RecB family exonuclease [Lentzea sp. JNUCC 0626]|uniref:RecB family exonuclease n=1 Tax=Lentzea sp. JNUCC 0626 TaxID=3367513 RepID=UPI003749CF05
MTLELPTRLSFSAKSLLTDCGERFRLERLYKIRGDTWFATVAGSAIHEITEHLDLVELGRRIGETPSFKSVFDRLLAEERAKGIEVNPSGKVLKSISLRGGPNKKDYDWWLIYGPKFVENWVSWKAQSAWKLAVLPDGQAAVEVRIDDPMGGDDHLGFIDRVYITPEGQVVVVDLKTGSVPLSALQLGTYAVGLWRKYGLLSTWGAYWMAGKGELTSLKDLSLYTEEYIDAQYEMAWNAIRAGVFLPNVTSLCRACGVREFCRAVGGARAVEIPVRDELQPAQIVSRTTDVKLAHSPLSV